MHNSIAAATAYNLHLRDRLADTERPCSLVAANTTAALAPWLYQTHYGLAKRRQLASYVDSGITGIAFLLPSLVDTHAYATTRDRLTWIYQEAAQHVATAVTPPHAASAYRRGFRVIVPDTPRRCVVRKRCQPAHVLGTVRRLGQPTGLGVELARFTPGAPRSLPPPPRADTDLATRPPRPPPRLTVAGASVKPTTERTCENSGPIEAAGFYPLSQTVRRLIDLGDQIT